MTAQELYEEYLKMREHEGFEDCANWKLENNGDNIDDEKWLRGVEKFIFKNKQVLVGGTEA